MSKKNRTHEQFMEKFYEKNSNANNIEILEEYVGCKIPIKCKCKICGYMWLPTPSNLLQNTKCPICSRKKMGDNKRKTHKQFIKEFYEKNSNAENIEILEEYKGSNIKIKCKCKIDKYEWYVTPHDLLEGYGCAKCNGNAKKTHKEFLNELKQTHPNIEVLEEYKGALKKIKFKCKIDGYIWETTPNSLLNNNNGCPKCNMSKGEKRIVQYFENNNIEYIWQFFSNDLIGVNGGFLLYDFYLPKYDLLIEYQGNYHDGTVNKKIQSDEKFNRQQEHDKRKKEYANNNNIQLLEIWYWDFDNIEEILDKILKLK